MTRLAVLAVDAALLLWRLVCQEASAWRRWPLGGPVGRR